MNNFKQDMMTNRFFKGKFDIRQLSSSPARDKDVILKEFNELPIDNYAPDSGRYREMITGYIDVKNKRVIYHNGVDRGGDSCFTYDQGAFNPEIKELRYFKSVSETFKQTEFLTNLLLTDFNITDLETHSREELVFFEVQLIKFEVNIERPIALCCPQVIHQDGNQYAFAHLIQRENIIGAFNCIGNMNCLNQEYIHANKEDILSEFVMYDFMESYGCDDTTLAHYVSDVKLANGATDGKRGIITVAFFDSYASFAKMCPGIHS